MKTSISYGVVFPYVREDNLQCFFLNNHCVYLFENQLAPKILTTNSLLPTVLTMSTGPPAQDQ